MKRLRLPIGMFVLAVVALLFVALRAYAINYCSITGTVYNPDGSTCNNCTITFTPNGQGAQVVSGTTVYPQTVFTTTNGSGALTAISLIQGTAMIVTITDSKGSVSAQQPVPIPYAAGVTISQLLAMNFLQPGVTTVNGLSTATKVITAAMSPYTVLDTDFLLACDATAGAVTINLPASAGSGRWLGFKKIDSTANACTVTPAGADRIDGKATWVFDTQWKADYIQDGKLQQWMVMNPSYTYHLEDFCSTVPTDGQVPVFNAATGKYCPGSGSGSMGIIDLCQLGFDCNPGVQFDSSVTATNGSTTVLGPSALFKATDCNVTHGAASGCTGSADKLINIYDFHTGVNGSAFVGKDQYFGGTIVGYGELPACAGQPAGSCITISSAYQGTTTSTAQIYWGKDEAATWNTTLNAAVQGSGAATKFNGALIYCHSPIMTSTTLATNRWTGQFFGTGAWVGFTDNFNNDKRCILIAGAPGLQGKPLLQVGATGFFTAHDFAWLGSNLYPPSAAISLTNANAAGANTGQSQTKIERVADNLGGALSPVDHFGLVDQTGADANMTAAQTSISLLDDRACTAAVTPAKCCTGLGTGNCGIYTNSDCTGAGTPAACCTGAGTGTCGTTSDAACTGPGAPDSCCSAAGVGDCHAPAHGLQANAPVYFYDDAAGTEIKQTSCLYTPGANPIRLGSNADCTALGLAGVTACNCCSGAGAGSCGTGLTRPHNTENTAIRWSGNAVATAGIRTDPLYANNDLISVSHMTDYYVDTALDWRQQQAVETHIDHVNAANSGTLLSMNNGGQMTLQNSELNNSAIMIYQNAGIILATDLANQPFERTSGVYPTTVDFPPNGTNYMLVQGIGGWFHCTGCNWAYNKLQPANGDFVSTGPLPLDNQIQLDDLRLTKSNVVPNPTQQQPTIRAYLVGQQNIAIKVRYSIVSGTPDNYVSYAESGTPTSSTTRQIDIQPMPGSSAGSYPTYVYNSLQGVDAYDANRDDRTTPQRTWAEYIAQATIPIAPVVTAVGAGAGTRYCYYVTGAVNNPKTPAVPCQTSISPVSNIVQNQQGGGGPGTLGLDSTTYFNNITVPAPTGVTALNFYRAIGTSATVCPAPSTAVFAGTVKIGTSSTPPSGAAPNRVGFTDTGITSGSAPPTANNCGNIIVDNIVNIGGDPVSFGDVQAVGHSQGQTTAALLPDWSQVINQIGTPAAWIRMGEAAGNLLDSSGNANTCVASVGGITYSQAGLVTDDPTTSVLFDGAAGNCVIATSATMPGGGVVPDEPLSYFEIINPVTFPTGVGSMGLAGQGNNGFGLSINSVGQLQLSQAGVGTVALSNASVDIGSVNLVGFTKTAGAIRLWINGRNVTGTIVSTPTFTPANGQLTLSGAAGTFLNAYGQEAVLYPTDVYATNATYPLRLFQEMGRRKNGTGYYDTTNKCYRTYTNNGWSDCNCGNNRTAAAGANVLPTCNAGTKGCSALVVDQVGATCAAAGYGAVATTGGAAVCHTVCDGTNWLLM